MIDPYLKSLMGKKVKIALRGEDEGDEMTVTGVGESVIVAVDQSGTRYINWTNIDYITPIELPRLKMEDSVTGSKLLPKDCGVCGIIGSELHRMIELSMIEPKKDKYYHGATKIHFLPEDRPATGRTTCGLETGHLPSGEAWTRDFNNCNCIACALVEGPL